MAEQKLFKSGNSLVISIPSDLRRKLNWRDGSKVVVEEKNQELVVKSAKTAPKGLNTKFMKIVDQFMTDHEDVLKELSQR